MSFLKRATVLASVAALTLGAALTAPAKAEQPTVAITQITEHPALDAVRQGVLDELSDRGFRPDDTYRLVYENAQGNTANAAQITRRLAGLSPEVIVAISTVSAQQVAATIKDVPIVFGAVTDPVAAGLVQNREQPEGNVTGVSSLAPIGQQLDLLLQISPDVEAIGVLYNSGEANSVILVNLLKEESEARGLSVREAAVTTSAENSTAARSLVGRVDAIYIPNDNTVVQGLEAILQVANENAIPVLAGDTGSVERGALASVGYSYYDIGREVGERVYRVLQGDAISNIPVEEVERVELYLNEGAASRLNIVFSDELMSSAAKVH